MSLKKQTLCCTVLHETLKQVCCGVTDLHQFHHIMMVQFLQDGNLFVHFLQRKRSFGEPILGV